MIEFQAWPKTPRLFRDMIITEKIDGTNAAVRVSPISAHLPEGGIFTPHGGRPAGWDYARDYLSSGAIMTEVDGVGYLVAAQSRKRLITPSQDNHGFARWVWENAEELVRALGEGTHYGEWWGSGIQRGYGLPKGEKRFSLFNVRRYERDPAGQHEVPGLGVVPVLYEGPFDTAEVESQVYRLRRFGSAAAPGFMNPEGIIVFHTASNNIYKVTVEDDEKPKGQG